MGCMCCSTRTGCIIIGALEIPDVFFQLLLMANTGSGALLFFGNTKIVVDVLLAVLVIYGAAKRNRNCLKVWIAVNIVRVLVSPLFYCGIAIGYIGLFVVKQNQTRNDAIGFGIYYIFSAIIILISLVQALYTIVVYRYNRILRKEEELNEFENKLETVSVWNEFVTSSATDMNALQKLKNVKILNVKFKRMTNVYIIYIYTSLGVVFITWNTK